MVLLNLVSNLEIEQSFGVCAAMLGLATLLQFRAVVWESRPIGAFATTDTAQSLKEMRPLLKTKDSAVGDFNESHAVNAEISSAKDDGTTIKRRHSWNLESP
jgi:hypothetical protein